MVVEIEHNAGEFEGRPWTTRHVLLSTSERVKLMGDMDAPRDGDWIEAPVTLTMKAQPHNLLQPFKVELIVRDFTVIAGPGGVVAAPPGGKDK
jgi:hypothetical protein